MNTNELPFDPRERAVRVITEPILTVATKVERARREVTAAIDMAKKIPEARPHVLDMLRQSVELSIIERALLDCSDRAAEAIPATPKEPRRAEVRWCECSMYSEPHTHGNWKPDEELP